MNAKSLTSEYGGQGVEVMSRGSEVKGNDVEVNGGLIRAQKYAS